MLISQAALMYGGVAAYLLASLLAIRHFSLGAAPRWAGRATVGAAVLLHAAAIAARAAEAAGFPAQNLQEFGLLTLTVMMAAVLALDLAKGMPSILYGTAPIAAIGIPLAGLVSRTAEASPVPPPAPGVWTALHVVAVTAGYACFLIAFVSGVIYIAAQQQLRRKSERAMSSPLPSLETALRVNRGAVLAGFVLLTAGILLGYFYARSAPPAAGWRIDPKVIFSSVTWACYGSVLALALRPAWRGRRAVIASMISFMSVIFTMWATYLSDFHGYS
jgi:ABC-type uncharacterized transport system permease subunit